MIERLKQQMQFIIEIDKIKSIIRKTKIFSENKYENDAEHSWHICMMAIVLSEHSNEEVDLLKVLKMLLIHDIVEIDAGDVLVYDKSDNNDIEEEKAAERIFGMLPEQQKNEYISLWKEFEKRETKEAKFAAALDRLEPAMQNLYYKCETWNQNNISHKKVVGVNKKIADGSSVLWEYFKKELDECKAEGLFATKD